MPAPYFMDMMSNNPFGSLNLQWNEGIERMNTWAGFMQCNNFGNLSLWQYPNMMMGNSYLINPNYSIAQTNWQWNQQGFGCSTPWANGGNMWGTLGWNPSNGKIGGSDGKKPETEEEKEYQKKYEAIKEFLDNIKDEKEARNAQTAIEFALENDDSEKSWKERFEALKTAYDKIGADNVKKFLINNDSLVLEGSTWKARLLEAGYEYSNTVADTKIVSIRSALDNLSSNNGNIDGIGDAVGVDALDFISSWNTKYGKPNKKEGFMQVFVEKYNALPTDEPGQKVRESSIGQLSTLIENFTTTARNLANSADAESKEKIIAAVDELDKQYSDAKNQNKATNISNGLIKAFDNLYLLTRLAAISKVAVDAKVNYGKFDSDLFDNELFLEKTKEDLKQEGFSDTEIKNAGIKIETEEVKEDNDRVVDPNEQIKSLKKDYIAETKKETINGVETEVYVTKETGRKLVINDEKVMEYKNGEFVDVDLDEIKDEIDTKRQEAAEEEKQNNINTKAKEYAKTLRKALVGRSSKNDYENVDNIIMLEMNDENVYAILKEYEAIKGGSDSFFRQMQTENHRECKNYTKKVVGHLINYVENQINKVTDSQKKQTLKAQLDELRGIQNNIGWKTHKDELDRVFKRITFCLA